MAKRKRLPLVGPNAALTIAPETKSVPSQRHAPIADMVGVASATAALDEMADILRDARETGRLIQPIPLEQVESAYLVRDRIALDDEDMAALRESLRVRGQQTPIELVALDNGRFGLISGWRRLAALKALLKETADPRFSTILAILRQPEGAQDAYQAMVEENEIRVGLTYYERARIAAKAVEQGIFDTPKAALLSLFRSASRSKRSKIRSFLSVVGALDDTLLFPQALGERLGLQLAKRLDNEPDFANALGRQLADEIPKNAAEELAVISKALENKPAPTKRAATFSERELRPGLMVRVEHKSGRVTLWGEALTPKMRGRLLTWVEQTR